MKIKAQHNKSAMFILAATALRRIFSRRAAGRLTLTSLMLAGTATLHAQPVIEAVTPPAWLQTTTHSEPARPGASISGQAAVATGRGGRVVVRLDAEQVELDANSVWEWQGSAGDEGNAIQGQVRFSKAAAGNSLRLRQGGSWTLSMQANGGLEAATRLATFLGNAGYPVNPAQSRDSGPDAAGRVLINDFISEEAAREVGQELQAMARGNIVAIDITRSAEASEPLASTPAEDAPVAP